MLDTTTQVAQKRARSDRDANRIHWLLIGAIAVTIIALSAVVWQSVADEAQPADLVSGFEDNAETTTGRLVGQGVTTQYFGHSGELYPENDQVSGFDTDDEATTAQTVRPGVTTQYFGHSGELFPETDLVSGFETTNESTTGKVVTGRVVTDYFGNSPELDPEK